MTTDTRPAPNSIHTDEGGNPYKVKYSTRHAVYAMHRGKEAIIKLDDWAQQMKPLEIAI